MANVLTTTEGVGQILQLDVPGRASPLEVQIAAESGGGGFGGAASAVYFVDQAAALGGDGSITAPFNTFGDAFLAAEADAASTFRPQTIWCAPGTYAEPPQTSAVGPFFLTVAGWNDGGDADTVGPSLPSIQLTGAGTLELNLVACNIGTMVVVDGVATLQAGARASSVTCDVLRAVDSFLNNGGWSAGTSADFTNCVLAGGGTAPLAIFRDCPEQSGPIAVTGDVILDGFTAGWGQITASGSVAVSDGSNAGQMLATVNTNTFNTSAAANTFAAVGGAGWSYAGDAQFTRAGAVLTYAGVIPRRFSLRAIVSCHVPAAPGSVSCGIAVNGDLLGQAVASALDFSTGGQAGFAESVVGATMNISVERLVTLAPGDTVQLAGATTVAGSNITIDRASLVPSIA